MATGAYSADGGKRGEYHSHGMEEQYMDSSTVNRLWTRQLGIPECKEREGGEKHLRVQHVIKKSLQGIPVLYDAPLNWIDQCLVITLLRRINGR